MRIYQIVYIMIDDGSWRSINVRGISVLLWDPMAEGPYFRFEDGSRMMYEYVLSHQNRTERDVSF